MKKIMKTGILLGAVVFSLMISACSSSPKRIMQITEVNSRAYDNYSKANATIIQGNSIKSAHYLQDAYIQALSVDNNELLCKIFLSSVSYRILFDEPELSEEKSLSDILFTDTENLISQARMYSAQTEKKDYLENIISVYEVRGSLYEAKKSGRFFDTDGQIRILDKLTKVLEKEPYYQAYLYRTKGECFAYAGNFSKAVENFEKSAELHIKNRYLTEIAYDYYLAAQGYSKAGNKDKAVSSIQNALKYDKDSENSSGIAQDYMAVALILSNNNPAKEDKSQALFYAEKAAKVYESIGFSEQAEVCRMWIEQNK